MDVRNSSGEVVSILNSSESRHGPPAPRQNDDGRVQHHQTQAQAQAQAQAQQPRHATSHHHHYRYSHPQQPPTLHRSSSSSVSSSSSSRLSLSSAFSTNSTAASSHSYSTSPTKSPEFALPYRLPLSLDLSLTRFPPGPASASAFGRTTRQTPSLTRTESSGTCTTHSPSPISTPADSQHLPLALDSLAYRPAPAPAPAPAAAATVVGPRSGLSSSYPFTKLPSLGEHPFILGQASSAASPPTYYHHHHQRPSLHSADSYGPSSFSPSSYAMDPSSRLAQGSSAALQQQMQAAAGEHLQFPGIVPQAYFGNGGFPGSPYDAQNMEAASSLAKPKTSQKKNSYPCPVAKQYGCNEFFTTSGHAARHAKKHTGKKDAICPECSKAFTRKDNMEQHRRTHTGVKATPKPTSSSDESRNKRLKIEKQKKAQESPIASAAPTPIMNNLLNLPMNMASMAQMEMGMLDPRLMDGTTGFNPADPSGFLATSFQQALPTFDGITRPTMHRSSYQDAGQQLKSMPSQSSSAPTPTSSSNNTPDNPSPSRAPALDALALAASRQ